MLKQSRFLYLLFSLLFSSLAYAEAPFEDMETANKQYDTYMGVNFKESWITPRNGWRNLFQNAEPGFNVYFGWRFHPNFGAELGYEWTNNKPKAFTVQNGNTLLRTLNNSGGPITLTSKVRFKTGALDLNAFIPLYALPFGEDIIPEGILSLGVAGAKPSVKISAVPLTPATAAFTNQFTQIEGRSKAIFRAGLGLQSMVIENFGARILWRLETTSLLRVRNGVIANNAGTRAIFKDAGTLAIGLFFKF
jgi:hypothetical protein